MRIKDFNHLTVYIFGGSSGIGLAAAQKAAAAGAHVFIFARNVERLKRAVEKIRPFRIRPSQQSDFFSVDVTAPDQVERAVTAAADRYGPPDILINCAGHAYPRPFSEISREQFQQTLAANLLGTCFTIQAALPYLRERGGYIVNTSSIAGFIGLYGYTDYAAAKFAVMGLSEALRNELKPLKIGVSVLCPPDTDTPGLAISEQTIPEETKAISASAKLMQPEEVAEALFKGIRRGAAVIIPGRDGKLIYLAKRLVPGLVEWVMDRTVKKTQRKKGR